MLSQSTTIGASILHRKAQRHAFLHTARDFTGEQYFCALPNKKAIYNIKTVGVYKKYNSCKLANQTNNMEYDFFELHFQCFNSCLTDPDLF